MFNKHTNSVDLQIRVDAFEAYCLMADIELTQMENNRFLIQFNNNFPNQDFKVESKNAILQKEGDDLIHTQEEDVDGNPLIDDDGNPITIYNIHKDYNLVLRRHDGYVKFTCPTYQGREVVISWKYRNEGWLLEDFCKIKHNIIYKD